MANKDHPIEKVHSDEEGVIITLSNDTDRFKGHFGILPLNTLNSLTMHPSIRGQREKICAVIDETIKPGSKILCNQLNGSFSVISKNTDDSAPVSAGNIRFEQVSETSIMEIKSAIKQMYPDDTGIDEAPCKSDTETILPHRKPYLLIEYYMIDKKGNVISRGKYNPDSPFNAPKEMGASMFGNLGPLAEFAAQSEAVRLLQKNSIGSVKNIVLLKKIDIEPLSIEDIDGLNENDILEARSIDPITSNGKNKCSSVVVGKLNVPEKFTPLVYIKIEGRVIRKELASQFGLEMPQDF